jgi:hypothetical protein
MKDLKTLLREYAQPIKTLAGADETVRTPTVAPPKEFDEERFLGDLEQTRRSYRSWSNACLIAAFVVIAAALVFSVWRPATAPVSAGLSGVSVLGVLTYAASQSKRRAQVDLLITLAKTMDPATLQTIVTILARSLT